jgi:hypothetical protein
MSGERGYGALKDALNWFIPELANKRVGSSRRMGRRGMVWVYLDSKKWTNVSLTLVTGHCTSSDGACWLAFHYCSCVVSRRD